MTEQEVFKVVIEELIKKLPHYAFHYATTCYDITCSDGECWNCYMRRPRISKWEVSQVIPQLEVIFSKRCTLERPNFYEVIKFFAD